jgi:putrescine transport system ATP-binding protein
MTGPLLEVDRLTKTYGAVRAVDDVSLHIERAEFFALLGPSGCGKTTLMRMIAGFEQPESGRILLDGADVTLLPPHRRPVNMMFQSYALFPHMSVGSNIAFPLRRQGVSSGEIVDRVRQLLRLVQLDGMEQRRPDQLSGGQKARVALARALAGRPRLLLLDEPLSALDRKLREETQFELMQVQRDLGVAFLVVTHDQDEAMAMAQRIAVMRAGRIEQIGAAREVYEEPASAWVASFIGDSNLIDARVVALSGEGASQRLVLGAGEGPIHTFDAPAPRAGALAVGDAVRLAVRAERIALKTGRPADGPALDGEVVDVAYLGGLSVWRVACAGGVSLRVAGMSAGGETFARGQRVFATWPAGAARVLTR